MKFIRYVGSEQCISPEYQEAIHGEQDVIVDHISATANATVDFWLDGKHMAPDIQGTMLDFLDLSILVYLADEMVGRSRTTDYWTRDFRCLLPVNTPDIWRTSESNIKDALGLLSGDSWNFEWLPLNGPPKARSHRLGLPEDYDVVCLFSGGVDSLLGAVQLLRQGRKVILVGHYAEGQTSSAQTALANILRARYPGHTKLVQCSVSRSRRTNPQYRLAAKKENTHRPRSFLFLALGVAIAARCGIHEVFMPENGLMALNIPLQKSRSGALSTRTAYPSYVLKVLQIAQRVAGYDVQIKNPFLTQSKTDMLHNLSASMNPLVLRSISCSRPGRYNDRHVIHCGYCVPCIHRRMALLEASLDSGGHYAFDVFNGFSSLDRSKQQDFRALFRFATQISQASTTKLLTLVLSHGYFPSDAGCTIGTTDTSSYDPWIEMLRRWASDFLLKVRNNASIQTRQQLGV